jgi:hypothetical protein
MPTASVACTSSAPSCMLKMLIRDRGEHSSIRRTVSVTSPPGISTSSRTPRHGDT